MVEYLAQIGMTGYSPMNDNVDVFDTADEAWEYLTDEREHGEDNTEGDGYTATVAKLRAMRGPGEVRAGTPGCDGDNDLGMYYIVTEVGHEVTGEMDGEITHASAKAVASGYARADGGVVEAFVFAGKIPYGDDGDLWRALVTPDEYASAARAETRLLDLLGTYIVARVAAGATGPVKGWPGMDVEREAVPWDVNPAECLFCGDAHGFCGCEATTSDMTTLAGDDPGGVVLAAVWKLRFAQGDEGVSAALRYVTEERGNNKEAIKRTMTRFAGRFNDIGEYARSVYHARMSTVVDGLDWVPFDEFTSAYVNWVKIGDDLEMSDAIEVIKTCEAVYVWR